MAVWPSTQLLLHPGLLMSLQTATLKHCLPPLDTELPQGGLYFMSTVADGIPEKSSIA